MAGHLMMQCMKDKDITVVVTYAMSMATSVMLAGKKVCLARDAQLGFHQPFRMSMGKKLPKSARDIRLSEVKEMKALNNLGYSWQKIIYLQKFTRLSDERNKLAIMPLGTMAGILGDRFIGYCGVES